MQIKTVRTVEIQKIHLRLHLYYDSYHANIKFKSKKMMQNLKSPTIFYLNKKYKRITGTNL